MSKSKGEHAIAILKAVLSCFPGAAPVFSLISDYVPSHTDKAIEEAFQYLGERIDQLESAERLDSEAVNKDEFSELFKTCYLAIIRTRRVEKLKAAANLIANILLKEGDEEKLPFTEADFFSRCLEDLSIGAIQVLTQAIEGLATQDRSGRPSKMSREHVRIGFSIIALRMDDTDPALLMGFIGELIRFNMLHSKGPPSVSHKTNLYDNYSFETTPLGYRFVKYILDPS